MLNKTTQDWRVTLEILLDDVIRTAVETQRSNEGYVRRNYVRAVFAAIEGSTYGLKRVVLQLWEHKQSKLNADELEFLIETGIDKKGKSKKRFLPFDKNIKFVFEVFAKMHDFISTADYNHKGWTVLLDTAEIRNRLMHPKSSKDLDISDTDLDKIREAADWYFSTRNQLVELATNEFKKEYFARRILH
jgi:hypothetical protein